MRKYSVFGFSPFAINMVLLDSGTFKKAAEEIVGAVKTMTDYMVFVSGTIPVDGLETAESDVVNAAQDAMMKASDNEIDPTRKEKFKKVAKGIVRVSETLKDHMAFISGTTDGANENAKTQQKRARRKHAAEDKGAAEYRDFMTACCISMAEKTISNEQKTKQKGDAIEDLNEAEKTSHKRAGRKSDVAKALRRKMMSAAIGPGPSVRQDGHLRPSRERHLRQDAFLGRHRHYRVRH